MPSMQHSLLVGFPPQRISRTNPFCVGISLDFLRRVFFPLNICFLPLSGKFALACICILQHGSSVNKLQVGQFTEKSGMRESEMDSKDIANMLKRRGLRPVCHSGIREWENQRFGKFRGEQRIDFNGGGYVCPVGSYYRVPPDFHKFLILWFSDSLKTHLCEFAIVCEK